MNIEETPAGRKGWYWSDGLSLAVLLVGAGARIYQWGLNRSLWLDEAYLAVNIVDRNAAGLAAPLEYNQSAPYLFLVITDVMTQLAGDGERVLRLVPLLASLATLWLFWRLVRGVLPPWAVPVAVAAVAFGYRNLYYAQELKQYSVEMLVVTGVLLLLLRMEVGAARRRFAALAAVGGLAIFAAHTAPFVLAGAGLAVAWRRWRGEVAISWIQIGVTGLGWALLFAVNYVWFIAPNYTNDLMQKFWAFAFPGWPVSAEAVRAWLVLTDEYLGYLGYLGGFKVMMVLLVLLGTVLAIARGRLVMLAAVVALLAYGVAVAAGKAPFFGRLSMFLSPLVLLVAFYGLGEGLRGRPALVIGLAILVTAFPSARALSRSVRPIVSQQPREILAYFERERRSDEPAFVTFWMEPSMRYYLRGKPEAMAGMTVGSEARIWEATTRRTGPPVRDADLDVALREMADVAGHGRFWVLEGNMERTRDVFVARISERYACRVEKQVQLRGAAAYLFVRD